MHLDFSLTAAKGTLKSQRISPETILKGMSSPCARDDGTIERAACNQKSYFIQYLDGLRDRSHRTLHTGKRQRGFKTLCSSPTRSCGTIVTPTAWWHFKQTWIPIVPHDIRNPEQIRLDICDTCALLQRSGKNEQDFCHGLSSYFELFRV